MTTVLVCGATGFIGSRVAAALLESGARVRTLSRRTTQIPGVTEIRGSITDEAAIWAAADGVDSVVHAASYIGYDPAECERTNIEGTRCLLNAVAGTPVVYISTAAVYGSGQLSGLSPEQLRVAPESSLSASRAAAETLVLSAGGSIVRPNFVYGKGDRWFIPGLLAAAAALSADKPSALVSLVHVEQLGRFTAELALTPQPGTYHAVDPSPVRLATVVEELRSALPPSPARELSAHQLAMLTEDNWYSPAAWPRIEPRGFSLSAKDLAFYLGNS